MTIERMEQDEVGYAKRLRTKAKLYQNGVLVVETFSECRAAFSGLRGRVLVICFDQAGVVHWVSQEFACHTRCALMDPSCASSGTDAWVDNLPEPVGRLTQSLDIVHLEGDSDRDFRTRVIDGIKATREVADEIKAIYDNLM